MMPNFWGMAEQVRGWPAGRVIWGGDFNVDLTEEVLEGGPRATRRRGLPGEEGAGVSRWMFAGGLTLAS